MIKITLLCNCTGDTTLVNINYNTSSYKYVKNISSDSLIYIYIYIYIYITGEKAIANFFHKHSNITQIQHSRIIYYTTDVKGYKTNNFSPHVFYHSLWEVFSFEK